MNHVSTNESDSTIIQSDNGSTKPGILQIKKEIIAEVFVLIHTGGLWEHLSEQSQEIGKKFLQDIADSGYKLNPPQPIGLSLSLSEYLNVINRTLNLKGLDSQFWQIVVKIQYLMMTLEKDPLLAQRLKEQSAVSGFVDEIFGD